MVSPYTGLRIEGSTYGYTPNAALASIPARKAEEPTNATASCLRSRKIHDAASPETARSGKMYPQGCSFKFEGTCGWSFMVHHVIPPVSAAAASHAMRATPR